MYVCTFLLPYIEQQAIYTSIVEYLNTTQNAYPWRIIQGTTIVRVGTFICPSDSLGQAGDANAHSRLSYHASGADSVMNDGETDIKKFRGPFRNGYLCPTDMGVFADGTSNTVIFSESSLCQPGGTNSIYGGMAIITAATLNDCLNAVSQKEIKGEGVIKRTDSTLPAWFKDEGTGRYWTEALTLYSLFQTVLPPNGPSCASGSDNYPYAGNVLQTANSRHTGGVNAAMGDGSVRFIGETINCGTDFTRNYAGDQEGVSFYGVWGALGTVDGGESAAAP